MNPSNTLLGPTERSVRVSLPRITLAMILCGIVSAAGIGAASAATPEGNAPSAIVKYDPDSLLTERGAHALYRKIVEAAAQVCPQPVDSRLPNESVLQCRAQSISRAVMKVDNSRLAAIHEGATRRG